MGRSHCAVPLDKQGNGANNADRGQYGGEQEPGSLIHRVILP